MDPNLNGTCFYKGLDHIREIRIKTYDEFKEQIVRGSTTFELRSSGHVLGGSTVLVESNKKKCI